jgi:hypothetical protein
MNYFQVAIGEAAARAKAQIREAALESSGLAECERRCQKIRKRLDQELGLIQQAAGAARRPLAASAPSRSKSLPKSFTAKLVKVLQAAPWQGTGGTSMKKSFNLQITKSVPAKNLVFRWASVGSKGPMGAREMVFDRQNDAIDIEALADGVHEYVKSGRHAGGDMHVKKGCGRLVASIVLDDEIQEALGIDCRQTGWFVGFELDPATFAAVKAGERSAFSISGSALRVPYETWAKEA